MARVEIEESTIKELEELGFDNPKRDAIDDTIDELYQQVENNGDLGVRMIQELSEHAAPNGFCKDNHDKVLEDWIMEKAEALHGVTSSFPYM